MEQVFVFGVPAHQRRHRLELAAILLPGADVMPPGGKATCQALDHPVASLQRRIGGLAKGLRTAHVRGHAFGDHGVPTEHAVQQLPADGVHLKARLATGLLIRHHDQ